MASAPATGTATVMVACKLPHGLVLQACEKIKKMEPVGGGLMREVDAYVPMGATFTIAGTAHPQNQAPSAEISNGFALTRGVPKDLWDRWLAQNQTLEAVRKGLIFAHEGAGKTKDETREKAKLRSGLERIDPNNLPPEFARARVPLKQADEQSRVEVAA